MLLLHANCYLETVLACKLFGLSAYRLDSITMTVLVPHLVLCVHVAILLVSMVGYFELSAWRFRSLQSGRGSTKYTIKL